MTENSQNRKEQPQRRKSETQGLTVLTPEDTFRFECRPGLSCFTRCCRDITIVLTPYDIIRMKTALGITSGRFLAAYTMSVVGDAGLPVVMLKMQDDREKSCPFVSEDGCRIYEDRPWSCRIYPLQPESTPVTEKTGKTYCSFLDIPFCRGFETDRSLTLADWFKEQGLSRYQEMEAPFKAITTNEVFSKNKITNRQIRDMVYMACFDLDRFRRFVTESSFMERFEVKQAEVDSIRGDEVALYFFAMRWLEYGLLGQHALKVKPDVLAAKKKELHME